MKGKIITYRRNIEARLKKLYYKKILISVFESLVKFLGLTALILFLLESLELLFHFDSATRTVLFFLLLFTLSILFVYLIFKNVLIKHGVFQGIDFYSLAKDVGDKYPQIKDELTNALQILDSTTGNTSAELTEAAFKRVYEKAVRLDFNETVKIKFRAKEVLLFTVFVLQLLFTLAVPCFSKAYTRLVQYYKDFTEPPKFSFVVKPGNAQITKGDDFKITVKIKGEQKKQIILKKKSIEDYDFNDYKLTIDTTGAFVKNFYSVSSSFEYFLSTDDVSSDTFSVKVIDRPVVKSLVFEAVPPSYSKLPTVIQKDNGNFNCLPGTKINISITASKPLDSAFVILNEKEAKPLEVNNDKGFVTFKVFKDLKYYFKITDKDKINNQSPIEYFIKTEKDDYPVIEIISPQKDVQLGSENFLSFLINISDDYGFTDLKLFYRLSQSEFKQTQKKFTYLKIPIDLSQKEEEVSYNWNLFPLSLSENDVVSYYLEIRDNDIINGPKATKTDVRTVRVPSLNELFEKADSTQKFSEEELKKTYTEAEKLRREIENISDELKQNKKKISWDEKQKIERVAKRFRQLQKKAEKIGKELEKARKSLQKNNLLSKETLKKYLELQKLFEEMSSKDLQKAFEKMQRMLQSMMRDKAQMSVTNLMMNEKALKKSLERTINLLKRVQIEQKTDELLKRVEKLRKEQKAITDSLKNKSSLDWKEKERLGKRQEKIKKGMKKLLEEMKKLAEKMNDLKDMPAKAMEQTLKKFAEQRNDKLSQQAQEQINSGEIQKATETQTQISRNLLSMKNSLSQIQNSIRMKNQLEVMAKMLSIINNLIQISKEEEALKNSTAKLSPQSSALDENARKQNEIKNETEKIVRQMTQLSQKTFAITPEMGKAIGSALSKMNSAISSLIDRNSSLAVINQRSAMKFLNESAQLMQGSLSNMMKPGGKGGGMMSLMQQLQQLTGQQINLNQLTKLLKKGKLNGKRLAELQRLARQQQLIRKSLEELNKEFKQSGESKKLASNLDEVIKEMKEVVTNLSSENIDDNLIRKQERILSRLLNAQRSINERDFEKRRQSQTAKQFGRLKSPPSLLLQTEEGRNKLKDALLKALREGYSKDYEDLIRKYFESLQKVTLPDSVK